MTQILNGIYAVHIDDICLYVIHIFLLKENNYIPTKRGVMGYCHMLYADEKIRTVIYQPME